MPRTPSCDVVIVGASTAGCTAAILLARQGVRVTLVEQHANPAAYKKMCTHFILPRAHAIMAGIGLDRPIEAAGGVPNALALWTRWGWVPAVDLTAEPGVEAHGYNIRRERMDPMLRELAASTEGVHYLAGYTAQALLRNGKRICGVTVTGRDGATLDIAARLTVGADGRESPLARMAAVRTSERRNARFTCFAYFRNIPGEDRSHSKMWMLEPTTAYQFPNDDGTTLIAVMPLKTELAQFKLDPEACLRRLAATLVQGPDLAGAELCSKAMIHSKNSSLLRARPPAGMALIGDAAMTCDPVAGVGMSWAFLSAAWLAEHVTQPLLASQAIEPALGRYFRQHRYELRAHYETIVDLSRGKALNPIQKQMFAAATRDEGAARLLRGFLGRDIGVGRFLSPLSIARALWINARHRLGKRGPLPPSRPCAVTPPSTIKETTNAFH